MRVSYALVLITVILSASTTPHAFSAEYASQSLTVTLYADGSAGIVYGVDVDPTLVRLSLELFSVTLIDLLVVNENGIPLVTSKSGSIVTVDTLGHRS